MTAIEIFEDALGIESPWKITHTELKMSDDNKRKEMHIYVDFAEGSEFSCPSCGETVKAYDTQVKTWRHMNFFQYRCYIHARIPRTKCDKHGAKTVDVPWGRIGSGFTLMFESIILTLIQHMSVSAVAREIGEHDTKIWRVLKHYTDLVLPERDFSDVREIGIDEYSHKGHQYVTVVLSHPTLIHAKARVIDIEDGKGKDTIEAFDKTFKEHNGNNEAIETITSDMSRGYKDAMKKKFKKASITIDKFHVIKQMNDALDKIRRRETISERPNTTEVFANTKYLWLKNKENLSFSQLTRLNELLTLKHLDTVIAYDFKLRLQDIYNTSEDRDSACYYFENLIEDLLNSNIKELIQVAKTLINNATEILNYFEGRKTNAILEGFNSMISIIKNRARGFRNLENFKNMIYFCLGDLNFPKATLVA